MLKAVAAHISTALSVTTILGGAAVWAFNVYAEDLIDERVGSRINALESAISQLKTQDTVQTLKLENIQRSLSDARDDQKEQRQDIKAILRKLSE